VGPGLSTNSETGVGRGIQGCTPLLDTHREAYLGIYPVIHTQGGIPRDIHPYIHTQGGIPRDKPLYIHPEVYPGRCLPSHNPEVYPGVYASLPCVYRVCTTLWEKGRLRRVPFGH